MTEKLGRVFLFGIAYVIMLAGMGVGIWLLCRLAGMGLELLRTPREKKQSRALRRHPLGKASLRARAAWLICCLEEALLACGLEPYPDRPEDCPWYPLLALLWQVTQWPAPMVAGEWLDQVGVFLPSVVFSCDPGPEEQIRPEQFAAAWALYTGAGYRMSFLAPLIELPARLVREYWDDPAARPGDSLVLLEEARRLLEDYGIPLPPGDRVDFLARQQSAGPGEGFVGQQCSYFVPCY